MSKINCKLLTPNALILEQELDMLVIPGMDGEIGILSGHVPMVVALKNGQLKTYLGAEVKYYQINGGFAHINSYSCNVMIEEIQEEVCATNRSN